MRNIAAKQLKEILQSHKDWLDSNGRKGCKAYLTDTILIGAKLRGVDLRRAELSCSNLSWINLTDTDLRGADLRNADLSDTEVRGADLDEVDLRDANLRGADLREANLSKADLTGADLRGADLRGAELNDSVLSGTNLNGTKFFYTDHSGTNRIGEDFSVALVGQTKLREKEQLKAVIEQKQIEIEKREREIELLKSKVQKKNSEKTKEYFDPADMISLHKDKEELVLISQAEFLDRYAWTLGKQKDTKISRSLRVNYNKAVLLLRGGLVLTKKKANKALVKMQELDMKKVIQACQSMFGEAYNLCQETTCWKKDQVFNCQLNAFDEYRDCDSFCSRSYFNSIHTTLPP